MLYEAEARHRSSFPCTARKVGNLHSLKSRLDRLRRERQKRTPGRRVENVDGRLAVIRTGAVELAHHEVVPASVTCCGRLRAILFPVRMLELFAVPLHGFPFMVRAPSLQVQEAAPR